MLDIDKSATILSLVAHLRENGSWAGETHVQKAMFFLDKKFSVQTDFEFVLYKHGPYSFELHENLAGLFAGCLLEHQIQPPYGPRIQLTEAGCKFLAKYADQLASKETSIKAVASWFEKKGVAELEKLATALWVQKESPSLPQQDKAQRIHAIKPHIPVEDARQALETVAALSL